MGKWEMRSTQVRKKNHFPPLLESNIFLMFSNYYEVLHNLIALLACETVAEAKTLRIQGMGI